MTHVIGEPRVAADRARAARQFGDPWSRPMPVATGPWSLAMRTGEAVRRLGWSR